MKCLFLFLLLASVLPMLSHSQSNTTQLYTESNYVMISQGLDAENSNQLYFIKYKNTQDTSYTLKKVYADSLYTQLLSKAFYKLNVLDGPFYGYALDSSRVQPLARFPNSLVEEALANYPTDTIVVTGYYKNGKLLGERQTHRGSNLVQQAGFTNGVRTGEWKDFNSQGQLKRKIIYNNKGRKISETTN